MCTLGPFVHREPFHITLYEHVNPKILKNNPALLRYNSHAVHSFKVYNVLILQRNSVIYNTDSYNVESARPPSGRV